MKDFWTKIQAKLKNNINVYLLLVVENSGSSPGRIGFKMFVATDGDMSGSIGGGVMEYKIVERLKKQLQNNNLKTELLEQVHTKKDKNSSGMICSGRQKNIFVPLTNKELSLLNNIVSCVESKTKGLLKITANSIAFELREVTKKYYFKFESEKKWQFIEQMGFIETFYLVGAGHVALATSKILKFLNFKIILFDNRKNLNTFESNEFVDEKHIISYENILDYIPSNKQNFIALMTNKYTEDKLVLSKLIDSDYFYLGVLGSKEKIKTMFASLLEQGVIQEKLDKIHAPIGMPIKSQTPEEIAVSIVAEVIKNKNYVTNNTIKLI